jgi:hypothetical protein
MASSEHFVPTDRAEVLLSASGRAILRTSGTPVLTVYLTEKWYQLVLVKSVRRELEIQEVYYDELDMAYPHGSGYVDHDPNPDAVRALAKAKMWEIDPLAEELIEGRWAMASRTTEDICPT